MVPKNVRVKPQTANNGGHRKIAVTPRSNICCDNPAGAREACDVPGQPFEPGGGICGGDC